MRASESEALPRSVPALALAALVLSAPLALAAPLPAASASSPIVAGPGAWLLNYATVAAVVAGDARPAFTNLDLMLHDVVAFTAVSPVDQPWCELYPPGQCPLFWTPLIPGFGAETEVLGLEHAVPGVPYAYHCTLHSAMRGTLVVLPSEAA